MQIAVVIGCTLTLMAALATRAAAQPVGEPPAAATSQAAAAVVELRLKDGSVIYGAVQSETADRVIVRTIGGGTVEVERSQIASLGPARGRVVDGEFRPSDSNATRLLFSPTGRSLRKGQGYIGVYEFLLPFVQVGVTDRFSMGAGTPLIFFGDESGRPVWLTPKYQLHKGARTSAAVGVLHFEIFGEESRAGLAYAVATTGSDDNAVTVGAGWAYARYREDQYDYSACLGRAPGSVAGCPTIERMTETPGSPVVMIGGERRLGRRVKIITENYAFKAGGIVSVGVRFLGERLSADLGVFAPLSDEDVFVVAPIVNFVWTFEK